jgi:dienelactone hydrolase
MRPNSTSVLRLLLAALFVASTSAHAIAPDRPLWRDLEPGQYKIGFKSLYAFDPSREWAETRSFRAAHSPDVHGRPIRVDIWYPTAGAGDSLPMKFGDYVNVSGGAGFESFDRQVHGRDRLIAALDVRENDPGELRNLLNTSVPARLNAPAAQGPFPLLFWIGGQNAGGQDGSVLAEFLASRGYVVASVALQGRFEGETTLRRRQPDIETTLRDYEFAWGLLRRDPLVDQSKVSVIGHSLGGVEAMLLADRNPNMSVAIGLDGTYGFKGTTDVLTSFYDYDPVRMRAAVLDLRKAAGEQGTELDLSPLLAMRYAERYRATLFRMHHSDFTSFALIAPLYGLSSNPDSTDLARGWTRQSGAVGFEAVCKIIASFLDFEMKGAPTGQTEFVAAVRAAPGGVLTIDAATEAPPSPVDILKLVQARGEEATLRLIENLRSHAPANTDVVDWAHLNNLGYDLMAEDRKQDAVVLLKLTAALFPTSADADDSLGDGYREAGEIARARRSYEHAIELVASDGHYPTADGKQDFIQGEQAKLKALAAQAVRSTTWR